MSERDPRARSAAFTAESVPDAYERLLVPAVFEPLPFDDDSFDVVLCQQGLQFFPEQAAATAEMRRVLRPGGVAGVSVWAAGHPVEPFGPYGAVRPLRG
jgi:ubiquinone/menaquinone biosynthesis C-methylase UbiE